LDMLTKEETGMTAVRTLAVTHVVDGHVKVVEEVTRAIDDNVNAHASVAALIFSPFSNSLHSNQSTHASALFRTAYF